MQTLHSSTRASCLPIPIPNPSENQPDTPSITRRTRRLHSTATASTITDTQEAIAMTRSTMGDRKAEAAGRTPRLSQLRGLTVTDLPSGHTRLYLSFADMCSSGANHLIQKRLFVALQ